MSATVVKRELGVKADPQPVSNAEFDDWARKLFNRIDRDKSGSITKDKLNCEEIRSVFHTCLAPGNSCTASYARSVMNVEQALAFCLRKADINRDGVLSFREFASFLRALKNEADIEHATDWVFALFDVDGSGDLNLDEFRQIFRFYMGRTITENEIEKSFSKMDPGGSGICSRACYVKWVAEFAPSEFRNHAGPVGEGESRTPSVLSDAMDSKTDLSCLMKGVRGPTPSFEKMMLRRVNPPFKPPWIERLNTTNVVVLNPMEPKRRKQYFSRPQSLPELKRYCRLHDRCKSLLGPLIPPEDVPHRSNLSNTLPTFLPERHVNYVGRTSVHGEVPKWDHHWQVPKSLAVPKPGDTATKSLRCPGECPLWLIHGRDLETVQRRWSSLDTSSPSLSSGSLFFH